MNTRMASDEVTDDIAAIEMHRQGTEQESGLAVACAEALRKLQALLEQEKENLRVHGPESVHAINVEAVSNHIRRVQSMSGGKGRAQSQGQGQGQGRGAMPRNARPRGGPQVPRPEKARNAPRGRGRRTLGRGGGRGRGGGGGAGGAGGATGGGPGAQ